MERAVRLEDIDNAQSLVGLFLQRAGEQGDKPFLTAKRADGWQSISYSQAERMVCLMAASLRRLGLTDGDRVMIVSENRPEWCIADLAIMAAGCITTPAYTTNTESDHRHILDDSGAKAVFVSDAKLAKALLPAIIKAGETRQVIAMEELPSAHQSGAIEMHGWQSLVEGDYATARADV
ncbi:MAG: AMP-binding protein, partial [Croceibacterium sp.]